MAFVCTVNDTEPQLIGDAAIMPIGYDDASPKSYSVLAGFDKTAGGDIELFYCIVEVNTKTNTERRYWSGLDTSFIQGTQRFLVKMAIQDTIELLLDYGSPTRFFCCTHDSHLPEKALQKHLIVAATFEMCGYKVERQPVCLGQHSWWMERAK